ncbi:MAG: hypothetical protein ACPGLY_11600 [Rubripirellula sp.]
MKVPTKITWLDGFAIALAIALAIGGCEIQDDMTASNSVPTESMNQDHKEHDHGEHDHPNHGPNGGELIELGMEAYHLEMLHDAEGVVFNVLDGSATTPVAIASTKMLVSLKHESGMKQFDLEASPRSSEEDGKASSFASDNPELAQWMAARAAGVVVLQIEGKSYTGEIKHDHEHGDHEHGDHEHGDHEH